MWLSLVRSYGEWTVKHSSNQSYSGDCTGTTSVNLHSIQYYVCDNLNILQLIRITVYPSRSGESLGIHFHLVGAWTIDSYANKKLPSYPVQSHKRLRTLTRCLVRPMRSIQKWSDIERLSKTRIDGGESQNVSLSLTLPATCLSLSSLSVSINLNQCNQSQSISINQCNQYSQSGNNYNV